MHIYDILYLDKIISISHVVSNRYYTCRKFIKKTNGEHYEFFDQSHEAEHV